MVGIRGVAGCPRPDWWKAAGMDDGRRLAAERRPGAGPAPTGSAPPAHPDVAPGRVPATRAPAADAVPGSPSYAVPGMVLLAALAIYEGYHRLKIIPGGSARPSGLAFAVVVAPATYVLTRHLVGGPARLLRRLSLGTAVAVPVLALAVMLGAGGTGDRALGLVSLLFAVSVLAQAATTERAGHRGPPR